MNHKKEILKNSFSLLSAQFIIASVAIIFLAITSRLLTKEEMAIVATFYIISSIISVISSFGFPVTLLREVPALLAKKELKKAQKLIKATFLYPLIFTAILSVILIFYSDYISKLLLKTSQYALQIKIVVGVVFIATLLNLLIIILQSLQQFPKISALLIFNNILQRIAALGFFSLWRINGYLIGWGLGIILTIFLALYFCRKYLFIPSGISNFPRLFRFSFPYYVSSFARYFFTQSDQFLVGIFFTPQTLALYYICRRFFDFSYQIIQNVLDPLALKIAEFKAEGFKKIEKAIYFGIRILAYIFVPFSLGLASLSYFILELFGGSKYISGYPILFLLSVSLLFFAYFSFFETFVYILDLPKRKLHLEIILGITQLLLTVILIKILGLTGVALSILFTYLIGIKIAYLWAKEKIKVKVDVKSLLKIISFGLIMTVILIGLQKIYYNFYIIPLYIITGALFFSLASLLTLKKEDWQTLKDILPPKIFELLPFKK